MPVRLPALALLLALAAPAAVAQTAPRSHLLADGGVMVAAGERVVLRRAAAGAPSLVSATPASAAEAAPPRAGTPGPDPVVAADGNIVLLLGELNGDVLLKVQSGLGKAFDYEADLLVPQAGGGMTAEPASVCTVLPLLVGYEMWPKRHIAAVVVRNFRLRDTNAVDCPKPRRPIRNLTPT